MPWNLLLLLHHRFIVTGYCFQVPTESKIDHCHLSATMFSSPLSNKSFYPLNYFWWFIGRTFESFLYFCSFLSSFSILKIELYCWGKFENKQMWLTSAFNSLLNSFLKEKKQFQQLRIVLQIRDDLTNSLVHLQRHFQGGKSVKIHAGNSVGGYSSWEISFREISIPPPQPSKQLRLLSSSLTSARDMSLFMPPILHPSTLLSRPMYVDSPTSPRLQIFILSNPRKVEPVWRNRSLSLSSLSLDCDSKERGSRDITSHLLKGLFFQPFIFHAPLERLSPIFPRHGFLSRSSEILRNYRPFLFRKLPVLREGGWKNIGSRAGAISPMTTFENYRRVARPMDETWIESVLFVILLFAPCCLSRPLPFIRG